MAEILFKEESEQQTPAKTEVAATCQNEAQAPKVASERYVSLDAYHGFIMLMLVSHAFGLNPLRDQPGWQWLAAHFEHVEWGDSFCGTSASLRSRGFLQDDQPFLSWK